MKQDTFNVTRSELTQLLTEVIGTRFFTVTFLKANGDLRVMNCQNVKGVTEISAKDNLTVWVPSLKEYRCFNLKRVEKITFKGFNFVVV